MSREELRKFGWVVGRSGLLTLAAGCLATTGLALCEVAMASMVHCMLYRIEASGTPPAFPFGFEAPSTLESTLGILVAVGFLRGVFYSTSLAIPSLVEQGATSRAREMIFRDYLDDPEKRDQGGLNRGLGDLAVRVGRFFGVVSQAVQTSVLVVLIVTAMLATSVKSGLMALVGLGIIGGFYRWALRAAQAKAASSRGPSRELFAVVDRVTKLMPMIRVNRLEGKEFAAFSVKNRRSAYYVSWASVLSVSTTTMTAVLGLVLLSSLVYFDQRFGDDIGAPILGFLYLLVRLTQVLNNLFGSVSSASVLWPAFADCSPWIRNELVPASSPFPLRRIPGSDHMDIRGERGVVAPPAPPIDIVGLKFGYSGGELLFNGLTLRVEAGEHLVVVGRSGLGKTTLMKLIAGLEHPEEGEVRLARISASDYARAHSQSIGYVGVDGHLFQGTVRSNVLYGADAELGDEDCWRALDLAAAGFVRNLVGGLEHPVEGDDSFSAGERQRICLARALVRNPRLLLLDEATSNLDATTEREVLATLRSLGRSCTVFAISHRTAALSAFDRVVDLNDAGARKAGAG